MTPSTPERDSGCPVAARGNNRPHRVYFQVDGFRLEWGFGVTLICTSWPSKNRKPISRSMEKPARRPRFASLAFRSPGAGEKGQRALPIAHPHQHCGIYQSQFPAFHSGQYPGSSQLLTAHRCPSQCELVEQESEELNLSPQFRSLLEKESAKASGVETASKQKTKDLTEHGQQS
jgi:hypothetical protein